MTSSHAIDARREPNTDGYVSEIFCSVQGEGLYVGQRQVFVRTAGCRATCHWCDTPASKEEVPACVVRGRNKQSLQNPLPAARIVQEVSRMASEVEAVNSVSITGGEPLEQPAFVRRIAIGLREAGMRVLLETSGIECEGLLDVLPFVDVVSMDVKLPSATGVNHLVSHQRFLQAATQREVYVKIVVDNGSTIDEIVRAVDLIAGVDHHIPLILQPESTALLTVGGEKEQRRRLLDKVWQAQTLAMRKLVDVRVIPQCHKVLRVP